MFWWANLIALLILGIYHLWVYHHLEKWHHRLANQEVELSQHTAGIKVREDRLLTAEVERATILRGRRNTPEEAPKKTSAARDTSQPKTMFHLLRDDAETGAG